MEIWEQYLGEEERMVRQTVRDLVRKVIAPHAQEVDEQAQFPTENIKAIADLGLMGLAIPETYGGGQASTLSYLITVEEIAAGCASTALIYMTQTNAALALLNAGSEDQCHRWLPDMANGRKLGALAMTEPGAGSDLAAIRTRAEWGGDHYRLTGTKTFVTNGSRADLVTVYARTSAGESAKGLSVFMVEKVMPGFRVGKIEKKMGVRGSDTAELVLDEVRVPVANLIGREGDGFRIAMSVLNKSRLSCAAQALGIAAGAYETALTYARERQTFGRHIGQHQAVQTILADMLIGIATARTYLYALARAVDQGGTYIKEPAVAKTLCSDLAMRVTTDAVQLLGGYGFIREYQVERMMRDAKVTQIYEGTNQILRLLIARELVDRQSS